MILDNGLEIPERDLTVRVSTARGPGGQHVNRSRTRVTLLFDLAGTDALDATQKGRVRRQLAGRLDAEGRVRVTCGRHRSQAMNRDEARARFAGLLVEALTPRRKRRATRPSAAERRRRLTQKKRRSEVKASRRKPGMGD